MTVILNWIIYYVCCTIFLEERLQVDFTDFFTVSINVVICEIMKISKAESGEYTVTVCILCVLFLIISYYVLYFLKIKVKSKFLKFCTPVIFYFSVVVILLVVIICFLVRVYTYEFSMEIMKKIENTICGIFISVILIGLMTFKILKISLFQTKEYLEEKARIRFYEQQRNYDKLTKEQLKNLSCLRHDFKNHLYVILERVRKGEREEAIQYIEKICGRAKEAEIIVMAENEILATILTIKNAVCKSKQIAFQYEIACGEIHIEDIDLNIVVANLMDNAIEAAEKCKEDNRKIFFKIKDAKQYVVIECINTCIETLKFQQTKLKTTKEDKQNHGFGMRNIKETVAKYDGQFEIACNDGFFSTKIMMENI